jgi:hypothetical protein
LVAAAAFVAQLAFVSAHTGAPNAEAAATAAFKTNNFNSDPNWEGVANRPDPLIPCSVRSFDFGWSNTKNAGGGAGEIGGKFMRSISNRAYYARVLSPAETLEDSLVASGKLIVTLPTSGIALFGWFNSKTSYDWRDADFVGLRINGTGSGTDPDDNKLQIFGELGTKNNFAIDDLVVGRLSGESIPASKVINWKLEYLPDTGTYGTLKLTVQAQGGTMYAKTVPLSRIQRQDGATMDRFGFINSQLDGDKEMLLYVDDLVVDGQTFAFASDPKWEGSNNHLTNGNECAVQRRNNFGYSATNNAGGTSGEIGGLVWHSSKKATYADVTGALTLKDTLYATGRIVLKQANPDSDLLFGWWNASTKAWPDAYAIKNVVAAQVGGISDTGFRLIPTYQTSAGTGDDGPSSAAAMLTPKGVSQAFWICYKPPASATAAGSLTVGIGSTHSTIAVTAKDFAKGATLNRFGIINWGDDQGALETVYFDDLRYTVGPGDTAPAAQCTA